MEYDAFDNEEGSFGEPESPLDSKIHAVRVLGADSLRFIRSMSSDLEESVWRSCIVTVLETSQLLSYVFPQTSDGGTISQSSSTVLAVTNLRCLDRSSVETLSIIAVVFCSLYIIVAAFLVFQQQSSRSSPIKLAVVNFKMLTQFFRESSLAFTTWLSIPLLEVLLSPLISGGHTAASYVSALIIFPIIAVICTIIKGTMIVTDPFSPSFTSMSHARFSIAQFLLRIQMVILYNIFPPSSFIPCLLCLTPSLALAYVFSMFGPYFVQLANQAQSVAAFIVFWAIFCKTIAYSVISGAVGLQIFLISAPFIAGAGFFIIKIRQAIVTDIPPLLMRNAFEVQVRIQTILQPVRFQRQHSHDFLVTVDNSDAHLAVCQTLFAQTSSCFPNSSFFYVFRAMFSFYYQASSFSALLYLEQAENHYPAWDAQYLIFKLRLEIQEFVVSTAEAKANIKFSEFNQALSTAVEADVDATLYQIKFWSMVNHATNEDLYDIGGEISKAMTNATSTYHQCVELSSSMSATALQLSAGFSRDILHDTVFSQGLAKSSEIAITSRRPNTDLELQKAYDKALFDDENIVLIISGDPNKLGQIQDCNTAAVNIFGFGDKAAMIRQNLTSLIPPPISLNHPNMMTANLQAGRQVFTGVTRLVFAMHRNRYIFPVLMYVSQFSTGLNGLSFLSVMSLEHPFKGDQIAMVDAASGLVTAVSSEFASWFQVDADVIASGKVRIDDFINSFTKNLHLFQLPNGHSLPITSLRRFIRESDESSYEFEVNISVSILGQNPNKAYLVIIHRGTGTSTIIPNNSIRNAGQIDLIINEDDNSIQRKPRLMSILSGRSTASGMAVRSNNTGTFVGISSEIRKRIRKGSSSRNLSHGLGKFQVLFYLTALVILILAIVTYATTSSMLGDFSSSVLFLTRSGTVRRLSSLQLGDQVHRLLLMHNGLWNESRDDVLVGMQASIDSLSVADLSVYKARSSLTTEQLRLLSEKVISASTKLTENGAGSKFITLLDLGLLVVSSARQLSKMNSSELTATQGVSAFSFLNSIRSVVPVFNRSTEMLQMQSEALYRSTKTWVMVLSFMPIPVMVCLVWAVVRPALNRAAKIKSAVGKLFSMVPSPAIHGIRVSCERRAKLHADIARSGLYRNARLTEYYNKTADIRVFENIPNNDDNIYDGPDSIPISKDKPWTGSFLDNLKISIGVILCITYFFATYMAGFNAVENTMIYKPAECNWAAYRQMAMLRVVLLLRMMAAEGISPLTKTSDTEILSAIDDLETVHLGLISGNSALGTVPVDSIYNLQDDIMFENGCTPPTWQECLLYRGKLLQGGAAAGLVEFIANARTAVAHIKSLCSPCISTDDMFNALLVTELSVVNILHDKYLSPTLAVSVDRYEEAMIDVIQTQYQKVSVSLLLIFGVSMGLVLAFVYRPMIEKLDQNIKQVQAMLLMIPEEVVTLNTRLRSFIETNQKILQV